MRTDARGFWNWDDSVAVLFLSEERPRVPVLPLGGLRKADLVPISLGLGGESTDLLIFIDFLSLVTLCSNPAELFALTIGFGLE